MVTQVDDPQQDPLSGTVEIFFGGTGTIVLRDMSAAPDCADGFFPDDVAGEGLGFFNGESGEPILFDLDANLACDDAVQDFAIAPGTCDGPGDSGDFLPLSRMVAPFSLCIRHVGTSGRDLEMTVLDVAADGLTARVGGSLSVFRMAFESGIPEAVDLPALQESQPYRHVVTVTDGATVPVAAEGSFEYHGQSRLVFVGKNRPPSAQIANATPTVECTSPAGEAVTLDASGSGDPDSTPGTNDDIVAYEWREDPGQPAETILAAGPLLSVTLPLGTHTIGLRVTDSQGATSTAETVVTVRDTTAPTLALAVDPNVLWPPNHRLVPVRLAWQVSDQCDLSASARLVSVSSSEPDTEILLRAERSGNGSGRTYEITCTASDATGNSASALPVVRVPHDLGEGPEPVQVGVEPAAAPGMAHLYWNAVSGAQGYDVIQGDVGSLKVDGGHVTLGSVRVLARLTTQNSSVQGATSTDGTAGAVPEGGKAFFYLVQYRDGHGANGYGTESVPLPREPAACDGGCPGDETQGVTSGGDPRRR